MSVNTIPYITEVSQDQRFLQALDPASCPIDGRRLDQLVNFAHKYAELLHYYDTNNQQAGDWSDFFPEWQALFPDAAIRANLPAWQDQLPASVDKNLISQPHLALFLTFVQLFRHAQTDLNAITQRHLDYYYQHILQFIKQPAKPDQVYVHFGLNDDVPSCVLPQGTKLDAGDDRYYVTDQELVIYPTQITRVHQLHVDADGKLYPSQFDPAKAEQPWYLFGENSQEMLPEVPLTGFAIASALLALAEGERGITLKLSFDEALTKSSVNIADFHFYVTVEKQWLEVNAANPVFSDGDTAISFTFSLTAEQPAIIGYDANQLEGNFATDAPMLRCLVDTDTAKYLSQCNLTSYDISTTTAAIAKLELTGDQGDIDSSQPFYPFGGLAPVGSQLNISHPEITAKRDQITAISLAIQWSGTPADFAAHYQVYSDVLGETINNNSFQADLTVFGKVLADKVQLFDASDATQLVTINSGDLDASAFENNAISFKLALPHTDKFQGFGQNQYAKIYVEQLTKQTGGDTSATLPDVAYLPVISSLKLSYTAQASAALTQGNFFHIHPFGYQTLSKSSPLVPDYAESMTYLGLKDLIVPEKLTMLWQVLPYSAEQYADTAPQLDWSYLTDKGWQHIEETTVDDATDKLQTSGVIQIQLPADASAAGPLMPQGLHWLAVSLAEQDSDPYSINQIAGVRTQAVRATAELAGLETLPADSISQLQEPRTEIAAVLQPMPGFAGKVPETDQAFYTRVSQQLRHKNRAVSAWDYSNLILQHFPEIYKAKCLPAARPDGTGTFEQLAGNLTILVVPVIDGKEQKPKLQPQVPRLLLEQIHSDMQQFTSAFTQLHLSNPVYAPVRIMCDVVFQHGLDERIYIEKLNQELIYLLAPWMRTGDEQDIVFGAVIYRSQIIQFIRQLDYVADIVKLELVFNQNFVDKVETSQVTGSILTSVEAHWINLEWQDAESDESGNHYWTIPADAEQVHLHIAGGQGGNSQNVNGGQGYAYNMLLDIGDNLIIPGQKLYASAGSAGENHFNCGDGGSASYLCTEAVQPLIIAAAGGGAANKQIGQHALPEGVDGSDGNYVDGDSGKGGTAGDAGSDNLAFGGEGWNAISNTSQPITGGAGNGYAGGGGAGYSGGGGGGRFDTADNGGYGGAGASFIAAGLNRSLIAEGAVNTGAGMFALRFINNIKK